METLSTELVGLPRKLASVRMRLVDARVGLDLFIAEAQKALATRELTVDQHVSLSAILASVELEAMRFDVIGAP